MLNTIFTKFKKIIFWIFRLFLNSLFWLIKNLKISFLKTKAFFKKKRLFSKILYTLLLLLIFRVAATITVPGVSSINNKSFSNQSSFLQLMDLMGGGAINKFSIVALGISPYITASILMTILQSEFFPPLHRLSNSGAAGRRKINIITRWITIVLGIFQSITISQSFTSGTLNLIHLNKALNTPWFTYFGLPCILLAGSMFTLFLGEQITNKGVGNGTSLIIFSGVATSIPSKISSAYTFFVPDGTSAATFLGMVNFIGYILLLLFIVYIVGYIYKSERHIPLQQTGKGITNDVSKMSFLPIKVNTAGVIPIMFASLVVVIPLQVAQLLKTYSPARHWIEHNMTFTSPVGLSLYILTIFFFTIIMSILIFQPPKIADSFLKNGTFIPGIRPGDETETYITRVVLRLSVFSAAYLSIIASSTYLMQIIIGMPASATVGGTPMIILVTVAIETWLQLKVRSKSGKITKLQKYAKLDSTGNKEVFLW